MYNKLSSFFSFLEFRRKNFIYIREINMGLYERNSHEIKEMFVMNEIYCKVIFEFDNLGLYGIIPGIKNAMQNELIRVYNIYAERCNSELTEKLNEEFNRLNPNYFTDNKGKEWYDLTEYNQFMAEHYQHLVVDDLNKSNASLILDFFVDPKEVQFKGRLKMNHSATIGFYIKEV